eukprot:8946250-Pyramimonas_sp.AAC.2
MQLPTASTASSSGVADAEVKALSHNGGVTEQYYWSQTKVRAAVRRTSVPKTCTIPTCTTSHCRSGSTIPSLKIPPRNLSPLLTAAVTLQ